MKRDDGEKQAERYEQQGLPELVDGPDAEVDAVVDDPVGAARVHVTVVERRPQESQGAGAQADHDDE